MNKFGIHLKNGSSFLGRCLTESLTASTAPLVCVLLAVPINEHGTDLNYLLPVMLYYACMKTGVFLIHGIVHIDNPYKIMKYCIITAFVGSFFLLNGDPTSKMYVAGAVITGIGLAPFSSIYKQVSDADDGTVNSSSIIKAVSTVILALIAVFCIVCKKRESCQVLYFWCIYLGLICLYIVFLPGNRNCSTDSFMTMKSRWVIHIVPAVLLFIMMATVSGYKSSGSANAFVMMFSSLILFTIWNLSVEDRKLYGYCAQTMWIGAIRGFEMLYALVYLTITHQGKFTMLLYLVILSAGFFGFLPDYLFRNCKPEKIIWITMKLSLVCMILVISGNVILMFLGVFLCVCLTNKCRNLNLEAYRNDNRVNKDEYRLRQDNMYSLGNGTMQAFEMIVFFIVGKLMFGHGSSLMNSYVSGLDADKNMTTLFIGGLICIICLFINIIVISKKSDNCVADNL